MNEKQQRNIQKFLKKINYQFKDSTLLPLALTHRSAGDHNNERLEFLGDSILNFVVGSALYKRFPKATEGQLTRMRSRLVRGETLAELAKHFDLGEVLLLGPGEVRTGGHQRNSILADGFEAVVGAIYLDSNIHTIESIVNTWFERYFNTVEQESLEKDPKTRLQELLQSQGLPTPTYEVADVTGPQHEQRFKVKGQVKNLKEVVEGEGPSRRKAEQDAALKILKLLGEKL